MKTSGDARLHWIKETTCLGLEIQGDIFEDFLNSKDSKLLETFLQEKTDGALILYLDETSSNGSNKNQVIYKRTILVTIINYKNKHIFIYL